MSRGEVIDLSLSTDDEKPAPKTGYEPKSASTINVEYPKNGSCELGNDLEEKDISPKRRRLNDPYGSPNEGFAALGDFSEIGSSSPVDFIATAIAKKHASVSVVDPWETEFRVLSREGSSITANTDSRRIESQCLSPDDSEDSLPEDIIRSSRLQPQKAISLSQRTSALLARLEKPKKGKEAQRREKEIDAMKGSDIEALSKNLANEESNAQIRAESASTKPRRRKKMTEEDETAKFEREQSRAENKAQKAKEKEEALELKRIMKEEKAKQKQLSAALAEVNKSKLDKKVTGPEMIVDLPASMDGQQVDTQIREFLKNLHIDVSPYQNPVPNMIKWRRKVKSRFSEAKGHWEVVEPMVIEDEKYVMCLMAAKEFVALASGASQQNVEAHVTKVKNCFEGCKPIYLIEGLTIWMRKNRTTLNRAYRTAVLNQLDENVDSASGESQTLNSRRKKDAPETVDEDMIEDALLRLQVVHSCLIHHTATTVESAEWVAIFTQQISTIPSRYYP